MTKFFKKHPRGVYSPLHRFATYYLANNEEKGGGVLSAEDGAAGADKKRELPGSSIRH